MSRFDFLTPEFISKHCRPCGLNVNMDVFPWKYMGMTDQEFMDETLHYAHGPEIPKNHQRALLGVVRASEEIILERKEFIDNREKALRPVQVKVGQQLELF